MVVVPPSKNMFRQNQDQEQERDRTHETHLRADAMRLLHPVRGGLGQTLLE